MLVVPMAPMMAARSGLTTFVRQERCQSILQASRRAGAVVFLGVIPIGLAAYYVAFVARDALGVDFRSAFWPAARDVLHGESPYPPLTREALSTATAFVYPPIIAIALAPVGLLPVGVATALAVATAFGSLVGALWVLGVRDWRCYT